MTSYNIYVQNYNYGSDARIERTPLTVDAGTVYTDGTFSTITLDSTIASNFGNHGTTSSRSNSNNNSNNSNSSKPGDATTIPQPSRCNLFFLVLIVGIAGTIQYHYAIRWGANALLVITGMASLVACETASTLHAITLVVWGGFALIGLVLFETIVVWHGRDKMLSWCLTYGDARYSSYESIPVGVCAAFYDDGTLDKIWMVVVVIGSLLGLPVLFHAVRTIYLFYASARNQSRRR
jgi:hypothetical protein